jgi:hypothetical protein
MTTGSPWEDTADLPDRDYEALYGEDAAWERFRAKVADLARSTAEHAAEGEAMLARSLLPPWPPLPGSPDCYTYAVWWSPSAQHFRACVAEFPPLMADGVSLQGALAALLDTVRVHLRQLAQAGQPFPRPRSDSAPTGRSVPGHS